MRTSPALLNDEGVAVTLLTAGAKEADGNPDEPLSDDARRAIQAEIDWIYGVFLDQVAAGLADAVVNPDAVIPALRADLAPQRQRTAPKPHRARRAARG